MKNNLCAILAVFLVTSCSVNEKCFLDKTICEVQGSYGGHPALDLYYTEKNSNKRLIKPPRGDYGFYVAAKQLDSSLYVVYQIYDKKYKCPDNDYISPAYVDYNIVLYKVVDGHLFGSYATTDKLSKFFNGSKVNRRKNLVCENGFIGYGV